MTALCATAERAAVLEADPAKNVFGGRYHVREPESQALQMRLGEAAECVVAWQERRMLVRARPSPWLCAVWCSMAAPSPVPWGWPRVPVTSALSMGAHLAACHANERVGVTGVQARSQSHRLTHQLDTRPTHA